MSWNWSILYRRALKAPEAPDTPASGGEGNNVRRVHRKSAYEGVGYSDSFHFSSRPGVSLSLI